MGAIGFGPELAPGRGARRAGPGFDFASGALPAGVTLTRASAGARFDAGGALVRDAAGVARFDREPVTLGARGLLIEGAATNLFAYSEQIDNSAGWTPVAASIAGNAATAPDGTTTADKLIAGTVSGSQQVAAASVPFVVGTPYTCSVFARPAGYRFLQMRYPGAVAASGNRYASFDLLTGTVAAMSSGMTAAVQALPGGFFRCQATKIAEGSATANMVAGITQTGVAGPETFAGDGVSGIVLWGAQFEAAATASSYVATTSAGAARAADVLTLDWGSQGVTDGAITVRYTFDDGSTQDAAATVAGGTATVPATLNRRWLLRAEKL